MSESSPIRARGPRSERLSKLLAWFICLTPFVGAVWLWRRFAVNVPVMDQWGLSWMFAAEAKSWRSLIANLFIGNNEHPVLFPKLIWLASGLATKWDTRVGAAVTIVVALVMFVAIIRMATPNLGDPLTLLATAVAGVAVFSFVHYDTWLWGFMLSLVLANAAFVIAAFVTYGPRTRPLGHLAIAWLLCLVASLSDLGGMASWLALLPCCLLLFENRRQRVLAIAGTVIGLLVTVALYRALFVLRPYETDRLFWLKHPVAGLSFFLALLGAPLSQNSFMRPERLAVIIGAVLLGAFILASLLLLQRSRWRNAVPWIAIGLYSVGFAAMTTIGRSGWGVGVASTQSRYMSSTVLITVAALLVLRELVRGTPHLTKPFVVLCCFVAALSVVSSIDVLPIVRQDKAGRGRAAAIVEIEKYIDKSTDASAQSCFFPLFPRRGYAGQVRTPAEVLGSLGFRTIANNVRFVANPARTYGSFNPTAGQAIVVRPDETITASGWAILPAESKLPKLVLITVDNSRLGITAALVGTVRRPDVAEALHNPAYVKSGWSVRIPAAFLPNGRSELNAWAYDGDAREFIHLSDTRGPILVLKVDVAHVKESSMRETR